MTEQGSTQSSLDQLEADYRRLSEQLARAETDYLELLEQTDQERAALAALREQAGREAADARRIREEAEQTAADEAAALREQAERDAAAAAAARQEAELLIAELRDRAQRDDEAQHDVAAIRAEAAELRARAERELAEAAAARQQAERDVAEARGQAERELTGVRAHVEQTADRLRSEAERHAEAVRTEAEQEAAAIRQRAERAAAELRAEVEREAADMASRREQTERLQQAAVEARTRAELELADVLARQEHAERDLAELTARQTAVARQIEAARIDATHKADRLREEATHEADQAIEEAAREAERLREEGARDAELIREDAEREAERVRGEAADALAALERLRAEHAVLRHSLGSLGALSPDEPVARPVPIHVPPRLAIVAVAMVVLCAFGAYVVASLGDKVYGGRVEILVDVPSSSSTADRQLSTQRVLIESQVVVGAVAEEEGVPVEEVERSLTVVGVGDSEVLRLTVGDEDPEVAVERAQAIADRYLELVENVDDEGVVDPAEASQPRDARLIAPARLLDDPIEPRPVRAAAGGGMAGLFLGGAILGTHVLVQRWRQSLRAARSAA